MAVAFYHYKVCSVLIPLGTSTHRKLLTWCCCFCFLQDMPGWGDDMNLVLSLKEVIRFLLDLRKKDYEAIRGGFSGEITASLLQCCLLEHMLSFHSYLRFSLQS